MGVIYLALPLDEEVADAVQEYEVNLPFEVKSSSSRPTPETLMNACNQLDGYEFNSGFEASGWQLDIENKNGELWTLVHLNGASDMNQYGDLIFEKGAPELILELLKLLAAKIGPFALFPDDGSQPVVVHPTIDIRNTLREWEHTSEW